MTESKTSRTALLREVRRLKRDVGDLHMQLDARAIELRDAERAVDHRTRTLARAPLRALTDHLLAVLRRGK